MGFTKGLFLIAAVLLTTSPVRAIPSLDQKRIHSLYNEGDFDGVIRQIAAFQLQSSGYSRDDSVFIAKHLAVVYAANPKSVGQGKYWMNELLKLMPAADLVGMYVSDEIDRIFEYVRKEFLVRQQSFGVDAGDVALPDRPKEPDGAAATGSGPAPAAPIAAVPDKDYGQDTDDTGHRPQKSEPVSASKMTTEGEKRFAMKRSYWILGGSALATTALGFTTFLLLSSSHESPSGREISIPRNPQAQ
jgi:hypothetical protein